MRALAVLLLFLGAVRHLGYQALDPAIQADAWNASGALCMSVLLIRLWYCERNTTLALVIAWWLFEEALVGICSLWRIVDWFPVSLGQDQCTAGTGIDFAVWSLILVATLVIKVSREPR